jgi:hypothetical protein
MVVQLGEASSDIKKIVFVGRETVGHSLEGGGFKGPERSNCNAVFGIVTVLRKSCVNH